MKERVDSPLTVVARAVGEFLQASDRGEKVDVETFCRGFPQVESELRQALSDVIRVREHLPEPVEGESPFHLSPLSDEVVSEIPHHLRELLERLREQSPRPDRYERKESVGRGGMGIVHRVFDHDLRRELAMKEIRPSRRAHGDPSAMTRVLARFIEEAQVAAQLDHPGIVPVHDMGLDADGQVYFTMKLVRGESLRSVFDKVHAGDEEWTTTRTLGVLQRVGEALAFAHSRKVIHRDLKPDNVMVGRFGEVYVMDWGLARVDTEDGQTPVGAIRRWREARVQTERHETPSGHESPLGTTEGDVLGTPAYMSLEQARGDQAHVGPLTDVYAVGAMLYELLSGLPPYTLPGKPLEGREIVQLICAGPPEPLNSGPGGRVPAELVAICERAMERDLNHRYGSMRELADDLRAYLERRVVRAYRTGAVAEFKLWVARNRATAALLASLLVVLPLGFGLVAWKEQQRANEAQRREQVAQESEEQIRRQADFLLAPELLQSADRIGPIHPDAAPAFEQWLARVDDLAARGDVYRAELSDLRQAGRPVDVEGYGDDPRADRLMTMRQLTSENPTIVERARGRLQIGGLSDADRRLFESEVRILEPEIEARRFEERLLEHGLERDLPWSFESAELQKQHDLLARLVAEIDDLTHPEFGVRQRVEARLARALELEAETLELHAEAWDEALEYIADDEMCPAYEGRGITPQLGLVPLGINPVTDLYEFWHVLSGERPVADGEGGYAIEAETGIVLVLVPGGTATIGAQAEDPRNPHYDPRATSREGPVHSTPLEPYFLSKYELTQGQWMRAGFENPSEKFAGSHWKDWGAVSRMHPVERVTWHQSRAALALWSLVLPTEVQWEYAARAGDGSIFWSGETYDSLRGRENLADLSLSKYFPGGVYDSRVDDGHPFHGPVDGFEPNAWGFHSLSGNVREWCADWIWQGDYGAPADPRTGLRESRGRKWRVVRGGSYRMTAPAARLAYRGHFYPDDSEEDIGVRPCRLLDPPKGDQP